MLVDPVTVQNQHRQRLAVGVFHQPNLSLGNYDGADPLTSLGIRVDRGRDRADRGSTGADKKVGDRLDVVGISATTCC